MDRSAKDRANTLEEIRRDVSDLTKRAKAIHKNRLDEFPETVTKVVNGVPTVIVGSSDLNRWTAFELLFGGDDSDERPFFNEFSGMRTDRNGNVIDGRYSVHDIVSALNALGMEGQNAKTIREAFAEWALRKRRNPLTERIAAKLPEWDGEERLAGSLMELFECHDTPLNRRMGWYFWTSLYVRCVFGGNNASIIMSLFGAQNCGKSYFTVRLVRELLNNQEALPTPLDLAGGSVQFLRTITGNSVIANIPEMVGFTSGDLNKIKAFVTNSSDTFDFKFEGSQTQNRQWIAVMDGNKYEGMQRDKTGNRRFYPVFCGQLDDEHDKPKWKAEPWQCDMITSQDRRFEEYMWNCLAESAAWIEANGLSEYNRQVGLIAAMVQEFSKGEMSRGRGAVEDSLLATYGIAALTVCRKHVWAGRKDRLGERAIEIKPVDFHQKLQAMSKRDAIPAHVDSFFASLGAEVILGTANRRVYRFAKWTSIDSFNDPETGLMASMGISEGEYIESSSDPVEDDRGERNGGF